MATQTKDSALVPVLIAVAVIAAVVVAALIYFASSTSDLDCARENADRAQEGLPALDCD